VLKTIADRLNGAWTGCSFGRHVSVAVAQVSQIKPSRVVVEGRCVSTL